ncbi:cysteine synthase family protein [Thiotrichales bacterium 19S3-7]|nr:cysteine synthase family protein [Thiotrichales bacterium 19S3-7]MCF6801740.1 cysteine synthase family protein [Thiotrichales bacterium 19S3-11]
MLRELKRLKGLFFNTPLIAIDLMLNGEAKRLYAKYEALSFSGSIKDRMAYYLFESAYKTETLKKNQPIVEVTSGNSGIALSMLGRALGHKVHIVMPDWLSPERYQLMRLAGAEIIKVSNKEDGFAQSMAIAKDLAKRQGMYYPDQFSNQSNIQAHKETTAFEIECALETLNLKLDRFVAAAGSGGTVMGINEYFYQKASKIKSHPLEVKNAPILSTGVGGAHKIQGLNGEFIAQLMDFDRLGQIVSVDENEALCVAYQLNRLGLSVGLSSGANFLGAIELLKAHPDDVIVTTFADSALKYLSSDLFASDASDLVLPQGIKLSGFSVISNRTKPLEILEHMDVQTA